jgi:FlaA1/EpsC-like NDP-sugar epimerase
MGRPIKILDLAEDMIRLSGLTPYEDVDIVFSGVRPGEKLFEELEINGENLLKTRHPKIFIGKIARYSNQQVDEILDQLRTAVAVSSEREIRRIFKDRLPETQVSVPELTAKTPLVSSEEAFFTKPTQLGLAEK